MKDRIGIAIVVLVSILISCFFTVGCVPASGYITIDSQSEVMQPMFCLHLDTYFQQQLSIGSITVRKMLLSSEEKKRGEFGSFLSWKDSQTVWDLEYKASDNFIKRLFRRWLTSPVSCLTYGEVPSGYQEKVKALSLEPEEFYGVLIWEHPEKRAGLLSFIIRLDSRGIPDRLEYHNGQYIITRFNTFTNPRDDLRLSK